MNYSIQPTFLPAKARRGRLVSIALSVAFSFSVAASAASSLKTYATLTLKDGRELSSVQVVNYTTTDVLVRHLGGATTLHTDVLPDNVLADLHLRAPAVLPPLALDDPAFLALADKVAVSTVYPSPAASNFSQVTIAPAASPGSNVTPAQIAAAATAPVNTRPVPLGEGNMTEFFTTPAAVAPVASAHHNWTNLAGRVVVRPVAGETRFLGNVEIRAYPADLLARYLVEARAKSVQLADQLRAEAAALVQAGRQAEGEALAARAAKTAASYVNFIPIAPYSARSDEFGQFTLRHDLRDVRLVATGQVGTARGDWSYAWIGIAPTEEALLTDANATAITAPDTAGARFVAAR